jgi:hypothetical protein
MQEFHKTRYIIVSHNFAKNLLILPQNDQYDKQIVFETDNDTLYLVTFIIKKNPLDLEC